MHMSRWSFFNKKLAHKVLGPTALLGIVLFMAACGDQQGVVGHETSNEEVNVGIALSKVAVSVVARAELVVTAPDIDAITAPLDIVDDRLVGSVVVPTGSGRLFTINAYDAAGALIYTGQARADVVPGSGTNLPRIAVGRVEAPSDLPPVVTKTAPNGEALRFLLVPRGVFLMGGENRDLGGREHTVYLDDYYIGEYEITLGQFAAFLTDVGPYAPGGSFTAENGQVFSYADREHRYLSSNYISDDDLFTVNSAEYNVDADHAATRITWLGAEAFCESLGARLPTEAEWEKAARGTDGRRFAWGDVYSDGAAALNINGFRLSDSDETFPWSEPVGSHPVDTSPFGALDMTGGVQEWVSDWMRVDYYFESPYENPKGPPKVIDGSHQKVVRGGNFTLQMLYNAQVTYRDFFTFSSDRSTLGVRCATGPE